jgi:hypothetical protein
LRADALSWHEASRESDSPLDIKAQYEKLLEWSKSREQPIRNVRLLKADAAQWQPISDDSIKKEEKDGSS